MKWRPLGKSDGGLWVLNQNVLEHVDRGSQGSTRAEGLTEEAGYSLGPLHPLHIYSC